MQLWIIIILRKTDINIYIRSSCLPNLDLLLRSSTLPGRYDFLRFSRRHGQRRPQDDLCPHHVAGVILPPGPRGPAYPFGCGGRFEEGPRLLGLDCQVEEKRPPLRAHGRFLPGQEGGPTGERDGFPDSQKRRGSPVCVWTASGSQEDAETT